MTVTELNMLPCITANIERILRYLEADSMVPEWFKPMETEPDPLREVLRGELPELMAEYRRLSAHIDGITDPQMKRIFEMRFIEQKSMREIGQNYGISSETTKRRLYIYLHSHPEGYFTCRELSEKWDLNINTVNGWCRKGLLPGATKQGKRIWMIPQNTERPQFNRSSGI